MAATDQIQLSKSRLMGYFVKEIQWLECFYFPKGRHWHLTYSIVQNMPEIKRLRFAGIVSYIFSNFVFRLFLN